MTVAERVTSAHESSEAVVYVSRDGIFASLASLKYGRSVGLLIMLHVHVMSMSVIRKAFPAIRLPPAFPPLRAVRAARASPPEALRSQSLAQLLSSRAPRPYGYARRGGGARRGPAGPAARGVARGEVSLSLRGSTY